MADSNSAPFVSKSLVEYLERIAPDRSPALETPAREIWFDAGQAAIVKHMRFLHQQQAKATLTGST